MTGYVPADPGGDRPLLMLGISDVIVLEAPPLVPFRVHVISAWGRWRREVAIPDAAAERIADLAASFQIVWASEWGHLAHSAFRDVLRLPAEPWPFLPVQFDKLPRIRSYAHGRAWAWVDDPVADLHDAREAVTDGVIVRVRPGAGIADIDAAELAARVSA